MYTQNNCVSTPILGQNNLNLKVEAANFGYDPPHCTMSLPRTYIFHSRCHSIHKARQSEWCVLPYVSCLMRGGFWDWISDDYSIPPHYTWPGVPTRWGEREVGIGVEVQITDGSLRYELLWLSKRKTKLKTNQEQQWSNGHTCTGITLLASLTELGSIESKLV